MLNIQIQISGSGEELLPTPLVLIIQTGKLLEHIHLKYAYSTNLALTTQNCTMFYFFTNHNYLLYSFTNSKW